jgi:hypothetical protein
VSGEEFAEQWSRGVRSWGSAPDGAAVMLTGTYQLHSDVSQRLLRAPPAMLVLRDEELDSPLVPLLASETAKDEQGQEAVLDRLLDLPLIAVLRAWFARPGTSAPGWYRAQRGSDRRSSPATDAPQPRPISRAQPSCLTRVGREPPSSGPAVRESGRLEDRLELLELAPNTPAYLVAELEYGRIADRVARVVAVLCPHHHAGARENAEVLGHVLLRGAERFLEFADRGI